MFYRCDFILYITNLQDKIIFLDPKFCHCFQSQYINIGVKSENSKRNTNYDAKFVNR